MKTIVYFFLSLMTFGLTSCNEDNLIEVPKDFYSPENSFVTEADFESALAYNYLAFRTDLYAPKDNHRNYTWMGYGLDLAGWKATYNTYSQIWGFATITADNGTTGGFYTMYYKWIFYANSIINRAEKPEVKWTSVDSKNQIIGEAKFLRAYSYNILANMFGGVPLVLDETQHAKFDYVRATRTQVYEQCVEDLKFATTYMRTVNQQKSGRAPRAAAFHVLTEVYISLGEYDKAIAAANSVINDPNFALMTERFGVLKNFKFSGYDYRGTAESWGDVYWDLFQKGNMNWKEGNKECIWNVQFDMYKVGGGGLDVNSGGGNFVLERYWGTNLWQQTDKNGLPLFLQDTCAGRSIGQYFPSDYLGIKIWEYKGDFDRDIRNSQFNVQREFYHTNPKSAFYGQKISPENFRSPNEFTKNYAPAFKKVNVTVPYGIAIDPTSKKKNDGGRTLKDWYIIRLPETLLLRAEAYMRKGDNDAAANDINVIRNRAKATPVTAAEVTLDLILDERARELCIEENRISTLTRTGKLVEYLKKYNQFYIDNPQYNLGDHLNLLPIPRSEIQRNSGAILEQNPGYN